LKKLIVLNKNFLYVKYISMKEYNTIADSSTARTQKVSVNLTIGNKVPTNQRPNGTFGMAMNTQNNKKRVYDSSDYTRFLKNKNSFRKTH
tara:strand:- start:938 stop:1207 length:270 start_codon:yes stop_codon:yes gene_type:complete